MSSTSMKSFEVRVLGCKRCDRALLYKINGIDTGITNPIRKEDVSYKEL